MALTTWATCIKWRSDDRLGDNRLSDDRYAIVERIQCEQGTFGWNVHFHGMCCEYIQSVEYMKSVIIWILFGMN